MNGQTSKHKKLVNPNFNRYRSITHTTSYVSPAFLNYSRYTSINFPLNHLQGNPGQDKGLVILDEQQDKSGAEDY